jgi:hypothetical protein
MHFEEGCLHCSSEEIILVPRSLQGSKRTIVMVVTQYGPNTEGLYARRSLQFLNGPEVLVILLKRFQQTSTGNRKLHDKVSFGLHFQYAFNRKTHTP